MTAQTLSRPLAARVAGLPEAADSLPNPAVPASVAQAAAEALAAGHTHYTDRPGVLNLRRRVVETLGKHDGIELSADEVTITCGATEARFVALKQLVKAGTVIACAGDGQAIAAAARLIGAEITSDPAPDAAVRLVYLTTADDQARVQSLLERAAAQQAWIVWDTSPGMGSGFHPAQNPALAAQVITIGSFSAALPGWRVGWMAGSQMANKLRAYKQSMTICTTSVSQWAALGLEADG
ncbi:MAG: pyridoxal phosphate-dependent aminotransferase [Chloroflexi bacterium]|nr:pyridoxal phosphate-dependent aminotransferase [Chloroflexota bacterium]